MYEIQKKHGRHKKLHTQQCIYLNATIVVTYELSFPILLENLIIMLIRSIES